LLAVRLKELLCGTTMWANSVHHFERMKSCADRLWHGWLSCV
jgi:hypothetical protein